MAPFASNNLANIAPGKRRIEDDENFSADEAMTYTIAKRNYLIQYVIWIFRNCELEPDDNDDIADDNDENNGGVIWILLTGFRSIWALKGDSCVTYQSTHIRMFIGERSKGMKVTTSHIIQVTIRQISCVIVCL